MSVVPSLIVVTDNVTQFKRKRHKAKAEEGVFTHRYWPPESTRYISWTVSVLLVSAVGLQHTPTGNDNSRQFTEMQGPVGSCGHQSVLVYML